MTPPDSDARDLATGGQQALEALFAQHRERLRRAVEVRLHPSLQARLDPDDVLQEAWLAAAQRQSTFAQSGLTPFVWLRRMVGQTLVDVLRRHVRTGMRSVKREAALPSGPPAQATDTLSAQLAASVTSPSQAAARLELHQRLRAALERLDAIDREIVVLRHFEALSNGEVAELLELGKTAASNRYVRALARLKAVLGGEDGER